VSRGVAAGVVLLVAGGLALAPAAAGGGDGAGEAAAGAGGRAEEARQEGAGAPLAPAHRDWLAAVAPLISEAEREGFVGLGLDYRRDTFIDEFWRVRDPHPETPRNELRERWEAQYAEARQRFGEPDDGRVGYYALFGAPSLVIPGRCPGLLEPLEIWRYEGGLIGRGRVHLVFIEPRGPGGRGYRLWNPGDGVMRISTAAAGVSEPTELLQAVAGGCFRGDEVAAGIASALDWTRLRESGGFVPDPGREWLATFLARSTELPAGAGTFDARLALSFPGRHQSRTVLQGLIAVPRAAASPDAASRSYDFAVDGEVLRKGELFESFRYRFHVPAATDPGALGDAEASGDAEGSLPLLFQRYLRPGVYELVVRVEDLASGRFFRDRRHIEVPAISGRTRGLPNAGEANGGEASREEDGGPTLLDALAVRSGDGAGGSRRAGADVAAGGGVTTGGVGSVAALDPAAEANAALGAGEECGLRLLPPQPGLQTGPTRVEAVISGAEVDGVSFALDGRPVAVKNRPPYSVEVDLGEAPRTHLVTAAALGPGGAVLARDQMVINAGPHRFAVRLVEPAPGRRYGTSLRAQAEVDVPEGDRLDRLELYLNDDRVATLYQPPLAHPVLLPSNLGPAYVRAVAFLAGGHSAEDLVYVNAPENLDRIDVRMVELFTSALDRRGRPVDDLGRDDFAVREEGEPQELRRFERVRDLPIWAGLLLDRSNSMAEEIREVTAGALAFFEQVLTPKDRAAVLTFNHEPELLVRFTADPEVLAGGVAGIRAEGGTALYDSLIYALYYFSGINGKRALLVISDGEDEGSRYGFDDALDYACRTGVAIYTIGLGLPARDAQIRMQLQRLATETGGRSFLISRASDLERVYESIEEELRTQYLLAYQSTYGGTDTAFREVEVEVNRPGVRASTIRGYFP